MTRLLTYQKYLIINMVQVNMQHQLPPMKSATILLVNPGSMASHLPLWVVGEVISLPVLTIAVSNTNGPDIALFTQPSVGSEPGVVYVMDDTNNDGLPNDGVWFEIKGSEYNNTETIHNYQVTYYKPGTSGFVTWKGQSGQNRYFGPGIR